VLNTAHRLVLPPSVGDERRRLFMDWYLGVLKKYAVFEGRARRKEYWMFVLFNLIVSVVLSILGRFAGLIVLSWIYSLALFIPSLAVSIRRLHDTNRSGWWILITLIPIIGAIILLVFLVQDSDPQENQYGSNPKAVQA
jgi:uncharacterized membrane protein YhaH (DUF805 family)